jgi:hypothetical protein
MKVDLRLVYRRKEANALHSEHPLLETERLVLKQITSKDWPAVLHHFSEAKLLRWTGFALIDGREQAEDVTRW